MNIYYCKHCKNLVVSINDSGVPMKCCGENMTLLVPNTEDGAKEKHIPVASIEDDKLLVKVGCVEHPMTEDHYIEWIAMETPHGFFVKYLKPGTKPEKVFPLIQGCDACKTAKKTIYAYCNLHGLYSTEI